MCGYKFLKGQVKNYERIYRVSMEVDVSAMERVIPPLCDGDNVVTFFLEVEAEDACDALETAMRNFVFDTSVVSIVPVCEG